MPARSPQTAEVPSAYSSAGLGSLVMMRDVMAIVAVIWARRCCGSARYRTHAPANRRTDASTTPAARNCADDGSGACPDQAAAYRTICGIVRIRRGRGRQQQSSADNAGDSRLLSHSLNSQCQG